MYKKVTGIAETCDEVLSNNYNSRQEFRNYTTQLIVKKNEYRDIKNEYERQKLQIKKEKAEAEKYSFTNMKKRPDFKPTTLKLANFHNVTALAINEPFLEYNEAKRAMMPDRAFVKDSKIWTMNKTCHGQYFSTTARQEDDVYDLNFLKYMRTRERGIIKPEPLGPLFKQKIIVVDQNDEKNTM